jgi:CTP:molybdopterin cytidylyltransferase MocA
MREVLAKHGVIVLAAGASARFGSRKQLAQLAGESLVHRAARLAMATQPADAVIVLGADAEAVFASARDLAVRRVECSDWRDGMSASLRAGVAALAAECAGALIVLCDPPGLDSEHLERICAAWRAEPQRAVASAYAGRLGVPALLPRAWFKELAQATGDRGARELLAQRRAAVVAVANEALALDIDTQSDLAHLHP